VIMIGVPSSVLFKRVLVSRERLAERRRGFGSPVSYGLSQGMKLSILSN